MPMYEFDCRKCGTRFEALVPLGTASLNCTACGSPETHRVMSSPGPAMRLVLSPGTAHQQEQRNAKLHKDTKDRFKERRRKAREGKGKPPPGAA